MHSRVIYLQNINATFHKVV